MAEEETAMERLRRCISRGEKVVSGLEGLKGKELLQAYRTELDEAFKDLINGAKKLLKELKEYEGNKREQLGKKVHLQKNDVFSECLSMLTRVEGLWYRHRALLPAKVSPESPLRESLDRVIMDAVRMVAPWVADCIRWAREALPPVEPFHDVLMEVKASFADALPQVLEIEEMKPII